MTVDVLMPVVCAECGITDWAPNDPKLCGICAEERVAIAQLRAEYQAQREAI